MSGRIVISPEVSAARRAGGPIVALESTIISHGLPRPENLRVAREVEEAIRAEGATPASIAVVDGQVRIGLDSESLALATRPGTCTLGGIRSVLNENKNFKITKEHVF